MSGMKRCQLAAFVAVGFCAIGALAQGSEPYSVVTWFIGPAGDYNVTCCCSPPDPHYIPEQQWGSGYTFTRWYIWCVGAPPP